MLSCFNLHILLALSVESQLQHNGSAIAAALQPEGTLAEAKLQMYCARVCNFRSWPGWLSQRFENRFLSVHRPLFSAAICIGSAPAVKAEPEQVLESCLRVYTVSTAAHRAQGGPMNIFIGVSHGSCSTPLKDMYFASEAACLLHATSTKKLSKP